MTDRVAKALNIHRAELPLALLAALFFFLVLCGYFFLRPVRDAMGVSGGMDQLRWLFVVTSVMSLVVVLAFGGVVSRLDRRRFIPIAYLFVIVCLLGFSGLLIWDAASGGGMIGSDAETTLARGVAYTFYVWLSVINLFSTSVFWAFMVDIFNVDQGKRMFAFIGVGGTLGALAGGWATTVISGATESLLLPAGLMLTGAAFFAGAIVVVLILDRRARASKHSKLTRPGVGREAGSGSDSADVGSGAAAAGAGSAGRRAEVSSDRIGGTFWDGAKSVATSPYLLGIGGYIMLLAVSNTLIYFTQANIIFDATDTFSQRVGSFALFDALAQGATLLTQLFITTRLIRRLGVGWTLAILPLVTMTGFAVLAVWTVYGVMALFQAIHRATRYAVSRPARETLFSVVSPSEKYKAKPIVDVFLYRGGDVAGVGLEGSLSKMGVALSGLALITVPIAAIWTLLSVALGKAQQRRDEAEAEEPPVLATPQAP